MMCIYSSFGATVEKANCDPGNWSRRSVKVSQVCCEADSLDVRDFTKKYSALQL